MKITGFTFEKYGSETIPYDWRDGLDGGKGGTKVELVMRVHTDEGIDGITWLRDHAISKDLIKRQIEPRFVGADPLLREQLWFKIWEIDRLEEFPMYALGYLDVALWDIAAKAAKVPLYKLMGGHKQRAKAYASTVTVPTIDDYLKLADASIEAGYKAVKLHVWGRVHDDVKLVRALRSHVGPDIELMLDGSAGYTLDESIRLGRAMEEEDYLWLEEPMREFSLWSYERLCETLDIPILAAECTDGCHFNASEWIRHGACDRIRTSWFYKGGFTGALKVAHLAESFQMEADVHGGGPGALQLVCAIPNSLYYEQIVPQAVLADATLHGPITPDADGWVYPPEVPGVGWDPDPARKVE